MVKKIKKDIFKNRSSLATAFLLIVFLIMAIRLFQLQVIDGSAARKLADSQHSIYKKLYPSRGEIKIFDFLSGQSEAVATNVKKYLVYAVPKEISDQKKTSENLAKILGMDILEISEKLGRAEKKYVPIKKQLSEEEQKLIKEAKFPGIYLDAEETRWYPQGRFLSQILGYVGFGKANKKIGLYGIEKEFEAELAGSEGELVQEKDAGGAWISGSKREYAPPKDGVNLILTIDKTLQFKAESIIKETVEKNGADSGSLIVAEPKTGRILAMANFPDFDPNEYSKEKDLKVFSNLSTIGNYEPGSIFKPLTMAMAINEGKVGPDTTYTDSGQVVIDNYTIKNSDKKSNGVQTMTQVLEKSLNTGVIFAKEQIGNKIFFDYIKRFGFGQATGIELPESKGNLDNLKANILVNFHTAAYGQGISVTPIQMIQAFTAIANGGKMMRPRIILSKVFSDGKTEEVKPEVAGEIVSEKTANTISAMMVSVVENGHGKKASVPGYYIAGKTGTAQVARKDGKGYEENNNIGSFVGFGPVENPKFLMLVRVNHPTSVNWAESTAAPAFGKMAQFILNYYQVQPTRAIENR